MTLALHGKSRQRQTLLVLLAFLAVGAAIFGGAVVQNSGSARAFEGIPGPTGNPGGFDECVAPNIALVIDNSTSIGNTELANMKTAVNSMIGQVESALPGTNWAGVHFRRPLGGGGIDTPTSAWNGGTANITTFVNTAVSDGYTPTASGIAAAIGLGTGSAGQPPLMIIITDGDPNVVLGDSSSAGTGSSNYINGAISAVNQAIAARSGGWNTMLAFFGPGDDFATDAINDDYGAGSYAAYNAAVRNGLAGTPNGGPSGQQLSVANASGLASAITSAILESCSGSVTINKVLDGQPAAGWDFTTSVSGGTANPAGPGYTTGGGGSVSFDVTLPGAGATATVSVAEDAFDTNTYAFGGATCTLDGQPVGTLTDQTVNGIEVGPGDDVVCTFTNRTLDQEITVNAHKIICPDESLLPDWGDGSEGQIDSTTASDFLAANTECELATGWGFEYQWGGSNPGNNTPGDTGLANFTTTTGGTVGTPATLTLTIQEGTLWVREMWDPAYIEFEGATSNAPQFSAEMYCSADAINYDNWERIEDTSGQSDLTPDTDYYCVAFNVASEGDITIEKRVFNPGTQTWDEHTDATPFTFDIDPVESGTTHSGVGPGTYTVAAGDYIVSEIIDGDDYVFVAFIDDVDECPSSPITVVDQQLRQVVGDVEVSVRPGDDVLVCAYNQPNEGSITIEKFVYDPETETWGPHTDPTPFTFDIDPDNGGTTHSGVGPGTHTVVPGFYFVSEVLPVAGYEFVGIFPALRGLCSEEPPTIEPEGNELFQEINDAFVGVFLGENVTVCAYNEPAEEVLADVNLFVNKFEADDDNAFSGTTGLAGWTINLECLSGECESGGFPTSLVTDGAGLASFGAVPFGTYEVCEVPQAGYTVVGSLLDGGNSQAGVCRTIEVSEEAAGDDITIVVDFFNHPEAGIRVEKRQLDDGALDVSDNGGWEITVEGCGESFTQTTNEAIPNSWTFFDVPPCDSYTVSEDPDSKPGYTPVSPTSVNISVGLGENALVTFVNDRQTTPTPTPTLPPGTTPTNTPTPVVETPTPVDPTNTPDPEDPTATPTPIDEVEGEITPGASPSPDAAATPIPPASGTGTFGGNAGSSMMMALLAFLMITSGAAVLALGRRETARN